MTSFSFRAFFVWVALCAIPAFALAAPDDPTIEDLSKAIQANPNDAPAYVKRERSWHDKNEHDKAIADFSEVIRKDGKNAAAYYLRGLSWQEKGLDEKAEADFEEAARLDPSDEPPARCS